MGLFDSLFKKKTAPAPVKQACTPQTELYGLPAVQLPDGLQGEALLKIWKEADRSYGHPVIILRDEMLEEMLTEFNVGSYRPGPLPDIDAYLAPYIKELEEPEQFEYLMGSPEDTGDAVRFFLSPGLSTAPRWLVWVPVGQPWEIFEKLPIGGWNDCPDANHMAAYCRKVYGSCGAVPALISGENLEMVPERRPTAEEAFPMALDMYGFCTDIVTQGVGTICALADTLLRSDIWYFWWD